MTETNISNNAWFNRYFNYMNAQFMKKVEEDRNRILPMTDVKEKNYRQRIHFISNVSSMAADDASFGLNFSDYEDEVFEPSLEEDSITWRI